MKLQGKVTIITGASRGIGRAIAIAFAKEGAKVAVAARRARGPNSLEETVKAIKDADGQVLAVRCDVTKAQDVQALIDAAVKCFSHIDIVVNNAGIGIWKDILSLTVEDWDSTMAVNLRGPFLACKFAVPVMMKHGSGNIINISSAMGQRYSPKDLAYAASKAALDRFTINLANELKEHNIAVTSYYPGYIATDMVKVDPTGTWTGTSLPPETTIPPLLWLAQQKASTFTGQVVKQTEFGKTWGEGVTASSEAARKEKP